MNGKPRDQISTDLEAGRPTISPTADPLAVRVARLMSQAESDRLFNGLDSRIRRSPSFALWLHAPDQYLSDFDPEVADAMEGDLMDLHRGLLKRARSRGWESEG